MQKRYDPQEPFDTGDTQDAWEPVYPDGSPVHECWNRRSLQRPKPPGQVQRPPRLRQEEDGD